VGVASSTLKQSIFMEIKLSQLLLGRHPLSDVSYWNPDIAIREQGPGRHRLSGAPYWNPDMMTSERGPDRHHLVTHCIGVRMYCQMNKGFRI
jgi:hypothetical protein